MRRPVLIALLLAGLWIAATPGPAAAHASLRRSTPAAGALLDRAPRTITITFTEPPDPKLSFVHLLDSHGRQLQARTVVPAGQHLSLQTAPSGELGRGTYTVSWKTASAVDGHTLRGMFSFGVGVRALPPTPAQAVPASRVSAATVAGRTLFYVGLLVLAGAAATGLVVFPRLPGRPTPILVAAVILAVAGLAAMAAGMAAEADVGIGQLLGSQVGRWLTARGAGLAAAAAAVAAVSARPERRWPLAALAAAVAATMAAHTMAGHAAAPSGLRPLELTSQWLHLLAVGGWIGGLGWLWYSLGRTIHAEQAAAVSRFSTLAAGALTVVAASGLVRAVTELGGPAHTDRLITTPYGRFLAVKVAVVAVLAAVAGLNRWRLVPALLAGDSSRRFRSAVAGELGLAVVALAATAVLSALPPPATPAPVAAPLAQVSASGADFATTVRLQLQLTPGASGPNQVTVEVADYDGGPAPTVTGMRLSAIPVGREEYGAASIGLRRQPGGRWQATTTALSLPGRWRISAQLLSANQPLTVDFTPVDIGATAGAS